jgi:peptidoglycan hydrolase CwlO-like protein
LNSVGISFIIYVMSDETTQEMNGSRSFEERVFARFDALDSRLQNVEAKMTDVDSRLQNLEAKAYDTKPIWEQALREIVETRRELSKRLDRIEAIAHETRADLRDAEDRIENLESKSS